MLGFLSFACLVAAATCNCDGSLAAWSTNEQCVKNTFLQPNSVAMESCYQESGCPNPLITASLTNHPIYNSGCQIYQKAGVKKGLNCPKFYSCANKVGATIAADATQCINNIAEYSNVKIPALDPFYLLFGFGNYNLSGTCKTTKLTSCMQNKVINVDGDTLQTRYCSAEHSCVASSFTNCDMTQLAPLVSNCLRSTYDMKQDAYNLQMGNCVGIFTEAPKINIAAVTDAMHKGFDLTASQFPSATCGLG